MTNWNVILNIAKTHLLTKMKSTVTASLGVTFGIGAYITLVSFMTGLNEMLDSLILNQTPHIHLYNEIEPSEQQPIDLYDRLQNGVNMIRSVKPKQSQTKIHNALPILNYLQKDNKVKGATPQLRAQIFYLSGSIELGGNLVGVDIMEETRLSNMRNYIVQGSARGFKEQPKRNTSGSRFGEKDVPRPRRQGTGQYGKGRCISAKDCRDLSKWHCRYRQRSKFCQPKDSATYFGRA